MESGENQLSEINDTRKYRKSIVNDGGSKAIRLPSFITDLYEWEIGTEIELLCFLKTKKILIRPLLPIEDFIEGDNTDYIKGDEGK